MSALEALKQKMLAQKSGQPEQPSQEKQSLPQTEEKKPDQTSTTITTTTISPSNPSSEITPITQLTDAQQLKQKVNELGGAILNQHPRMPTLLREIHTTLLQQPENVTLLSEEEIKTIVNGLEVQTGVFLTQAVMTKPTAKKAATSRIKELGADAF